MTGDEIRVARERAGLTQDELGELVGVSSRTVSNWERGASSPRNKLTKLREVLDEGATAKVATEAPAAPLQDVSDASLLAEIARRFDEGRSRKKAGDGDVEATSITRAGVSPATGADDGLGAFGGRARGDLDHESVNDGAGDNVRRLPTEYFTEPPAAEDTAAYRTRNRGKELRGELDKHDDESQDPEDWE